MLRRTIRNRRFGKHHVENGVKQDVLIPDGEGFEEVYEGNCEEFLMTFNGQSRFRRYTDDEGEFDPDCFVF